MNRLAQSQSPYLLQHTENPVNWYPWGAEAFAAAQAENKPIFLSVGYSTCHWCHVMAHESFEDEEIAAILNGHFICIKLDREERPDIDHIYMSYTQAAVGRGGWPNSVFLTPDREPFYAGTYWPKEQFRQILLGLAKEWQTDSADVRSHAERIANVLAEGLAATNPGEVTLEALHQAADRTLDRYDLEHGGFLPAPKFPMADSLILLLRSDHRRKEQEATNAVLRTLGKMRLGGIYDQLDYGLHRYSTDEAWHVPHFEKMLYDQALLALACIEAYDRSKIDLFARMTDELLDYVDRRLSDPGGAFWSAQDADSEGEEGKTYVWHEDELRAALTESEFNMAKAWFGTQSGGNFIDPHHPEIRGRNILTLRPDLQLDDPVLEDLRHKLRRARDARPQPMTDDKCLLEWNGLMIAAMARAGAHLDSPEWTARAANAALFWVKQPTLPHQVKGGVPAGRVLAADLAAFGWGLTELYEATFEPEWLAIALRVAEQLISEFADGMDGFFSSPAEAELLSRSKVWVDSATPSANGLACNFLLRLARLTGRADLEERVRKTIETFGADLARVPEAADSLMLALDALLGPSQEIVVVASEEHLALDTLHGLRAVYAPRAVMLLKTPESAEALATVAPYTAEMPIEPNTVKVYLCSGFACERPMDPGEAIRRLQELA